MVKIVGYDKTNGVCDTLGTFEQIPYAFMYGKMLVPLIKEHRILSTANSPYDVLELCAEDLDKGIALIVL